MEAETLRARKPRLLEQFRQIHRGLHTTIGIASGRTDLRRRFGEEAQALQSGKAYDASESFAYIKARARGEKARRPCPKASPKSRGLRNPPR